MSVSRIIMASAGGSDDIPDATFSFTDKTGAELSTVYSTSVLLTGFDETPWTVTGGQGSVDNVNWSTSGKLLKGQTFYIRGTSSSSYNTIVNVVATFGPQNALVSDTFSITTRGPITEPPGGFSISATTGANINTVTTSSTVTITGLDPSQSITVSASGGTVDAGTSTLSGSFAASKTVISSGSGTIVIAARATSSSSYNTSVTVSVTIGSKSANYVITTKTTPQASQFTFTDVTGATINTVYTSGTLTVSGFDSGQSVTVSASGGTVDAGTTSLSGTYASSKTVNASASGTIVIAARVTSSGSFNTSVNCIVTIDSISDTYTVTTGSADTTPNAFTFTDVSGVELNTLTTSSAILPTGYDYASWSVTGGQGSTDGSTWATSGSITNGQNFYVRGTSSGSFSTSVNVTATIGGVSDIFTITTRAVDQTPVAFSFSTQNGVNVNTTVNYASWTGALTVSGLEPNYSITVSATGGTVDAGTSTLSGTYATSKTVTTSATGTLVVSPQVTSSANFNSSASVTITIGTGSASWTVNTISADESPNAFSFTSVSGASLNTVYTSNTVTVSGLQPNYPITVSATNGTIDAGTSALSGIFASSKTVTTSSTGTLVVAARVTSSSSTGTTTSVNITVGTGTSTFSVTTLTQSAPNNLANGFTDQTGASLSTVYQSNTLTLTGLTPSSSYTLYLGPAAADDSFDAGTSALSGTWAVGSGSSKTVTSTASGTMVVAMRVTSSSSYNTLKSATLSIAGAADTFSVTTRAADLVPNQFTFTDVTGATVSTVYTSATVTISGMDSGQSISVSCTGGTIDAGSTALSGTFATSKTVTTSASGSIVVAARVTSSASFNTAVDVTVSIGTVSDIYTVTTGGAPVGDQVFTSSGTWTCPAGVTSACMVAVGGSGAGFASATYGGGGGGGALAYVNNVTVVPGRQYSVTVGAGGVSSTFAAGGESSVSYLGTYYVRAGGGSTATGQAGSGNGAAGAAGGTVILGTGGAGGAGAYRYGTSPNYYSGGGGGAGGYSGAGGQGGGNGVAAAAGSGGGGGGGASALTSSSGAGGGVGLYGQGTNGAAGTGSGGMGGGGSGGTTSTDTTYRKGGAYGGGSGARIEASAAGNSGATGAVRIMWGTGRSFPSNAA